MHQKHQYHCSYQSNQNLSLQDWLQRLQAYLQLHKSQHIPVIQILFLPTLQGSPGHRILGMKLMRLDGSWVGLWRPIIRTALLIVVIPAVIWDADQRGLHDKAAGTVLVRA